jgi:hypothetical protein
MAVSAEATMTTSSAPAIKLSFKEIVSSVHKQNSSSKSVEGASKKLEQPPPSKLITFFTLDDKTKDSMGKKARSLGTASSEPAPKKPSQNSQALT